jgi:hypothetical protein
MAKTSTLAGDVAAETGPVPGRRPEQDQHAVGDVAQQGSPGQAPCPVAGDGKPNRHAGHDHEANRVDDEPAALHELADHEGGRHGGRRVDQHADG